MVLIARSASRVKNAWCAVIEHVRKRQQPRENVILNDLRRQVPEEQLLLFFVHVESDISDVPRLESLNERDRVDHAPTTCVDDHYVRLHPLYRRGIDHVSRVTRERCMQRDDLRLFPQVFSDP